jgi:hypothetical protein
MKPNELQKIREKHQKQFGKWRCQHCYENYPCDVVKLLDYSESLEKVTNEAI